MSDPVRGAGLGLRAAHVGPLLAAEGSLRWLEALTDNYLVEDSAAVDGLLALRERTAVTLHGVGMNLGSVDALDRDYVKRVRRLAELIDAGWISEHASWIGVDGRYAHDLLPLPRTGEALELLSSRIREAQDLLGRPLLIENVAAYADLDASEMDDATFLLELVKRTGCALLLDISNVYVNAANQGVDARRVIASLPRGSVKQIHLAGHEDAGTHLLDAHGASVAEAVWALYGFALAVLGPVPSSIERDRDVPPLDDLMREVRRAQDAMRALG